MVRSHPGPLTFMEYVVLLDESGNEIGTALKESVHSANTPLHKAFSFFLFNNQNKLLLTKRSWKKKAFAGVWTNTCCGHPALGETYDTAICRRLAEELGLSGVLHIQKVADYRYRFADVNGMVENEICPIFIGRSEVDPVPNTDEVSDWKWIDWQEFLVGLDIPSNNYSPWCVEEARIIQARGVLPVVL